MGAKATKAVRVCVPPRGKVGPMWDTDIPDTVEVPEAAAKDGGRRRSRRSKSMEAMPVEGVEVQRRPITDADGATLAGDVRRQPPPFVRRLRLAGAIRSAMAKRKRDAAAADGDKLGGRAIISIGLGSSREMKISRPELVHGGFRGAGASAGAGGLVAEAAPASGGADGDDDIMMLYLQEQLQRAQAQGGGGTERRCSATATVAGWRPALESITEEWGEHAPAGAESLAEAGPELRRSLSDISAYYNMAAAPGLGGGDDFFDRVSLATLRKKGAAVAAAPPRPPRPAARPVWALDAAA